MSALLATAEGTTNEKIGKDRQDVKSKIPSWRGARDGVKQELWELAMQQELGDLEDNATSASVELVAEGPEIGGGDVDFTMKDQSARGGC